MSWLWKTNESPWIQIVLDQDTQLELQCGVLVTWLLVPYSVKHLAGVHMINVEDVTKMSSLYHPYGQQRLQYHIDFWSCNSATDLKEAYIDVGENCWNCKEEILIIKY